MHYIVFFFLSQMYKEEEGTGRIRLTMSKDSTCHLLAQDRFTPLTAAQKIALTEFNCLTIQGLRDLLPGTPTHPALAGNSSKDQLQVFPEKSD